MMITSHFCSQAFSHGNSRSELVWRFCQEESAVLFNLLYGLYEFQMEIDILVRMTSAYRQVAVLKNQAFTAIACSEFSGM